MPATWWKGRRGEWYVVAQFLLIAVVMFGPRRWGGWPAAALPLSTLRLVIGIVLILAGAHIAIAGALRLGANLTPLPHPREQGTLIREGAYGVVRHPIYAGLLLGALGWALAHGTLPVFAYAAVLFLLLNVKASREERWLAAKHPDYHAYQQRVRKLIPYLY